MKLAKICSNINPSPYYIISIKEQNPEPKKDLIFDKIICIYLEKS